MASIFPTDTDVKPIQEGELEVIGLDSDDTEQLLSALSSDTSRDILASLHETPDTASALADQLDSSVQNIQYHIENLRNAGLIRVADTVYSSKGNEMNVYAPSDNPILIFAGRERDAVEFREVLKSFLGSIGLLGLLSVFVQWFVDSSISRSDVQNNVGINQLQTEGSRVQEVSDGILTSIPPGLLFFSGGLIIILLSFSWWYWKK